MSEHKNPKQIGLYIATSLVVGNMIGSGIFMLPASMAELGSISLIGWIISGAGAIMVAFVFSRLSKLVPKTGGPYVYPKEGFGDFIGFLSGWGYWASVLLTNASIAMVFTGYLAVFIPSIADSTTLMVMVPVTTVWLLTWYNSRGVKAGGQLQLLTTILKIIPIIAVSIAALFYFDFNNLIPFNSSETSAMSVIGASVTLTLFAFLGIESATIPAKSIKNPEVTIPKATIYGTVITLIVYFVGSLAIMGILPQSALKESTAPFADAAFLLWGDVGRYLVGFGALISTFGALNGWILIQSQLPYAMSVDKLLPPIFAKSSKNDIPIYSLVFSSLFITIVIIANSSKGLVEIFTMLILIGTFLSLITYLFSSMSEVLIRIKNSEKLDKALIGRAFLVGIPAFLFSVLAIYGAGLEVVFYGFIILILGTPIYVWSKVKQAQEKS